MISYVESFMRMILYLLRVVKKSKDIHHEAHEGHYLFGKNCLLYTNERFISLYFRLFVIHRELRVLRGEKF